jgi:hypothetical protein
MLPYYNGDGENLSSEDDAWRNDDDTPPTREEEEEDEDGSFNNQVDSPVDEDESQVPSDAEVQGNQDEAEDGEELEEAQEAASADSGDGSVAGDGEEKTPSQSSKKKSKLQRRGGQRSSSHSPGGDPDNDEDGSATSAQEEETTPSGTNNKASMRLRRRGGQGSSKGTAWRTPILTRGRLALSKVPSTGSKRGRQTNWTLKKQFKTKNSVESIGDEEKVITVGHRYELRSRKLKILATGLDH